MQQKFSEYIIEVCFRGVITIKSNRNYSVPQTLPVYRHTSYFNSLYVCELGFFLSLINSLDK